MLCVLYEFLPVIKNVTGMNILVATSFFLLTATFCILLYFLRVIYSRNFNVQKLHILLIIDTCYGLQNFPSKSCTTFPILLAALGITFFSFLLI